MDTDQRRWAFGMQDNRSIGLPYALLALSVQQAPTSGECPPEASERAERRPPVTA